MKTGTRSSLLTVGLTLTVVLSVAGCGGGPCHGNECAGSSHGTGNFTPGPLPHSAVELDGPRCAAAGPRLEIFQRRLFTEPDPPAVVRTTDLLTVYWSLCNTGDGPSDPIAAGYQFVGRRVNASGTTEVRRTNHDIPHLEACRCSVESETTQNELPPDRYDFTLEGRFSEAVTRVISP
jgi:hypothetical protein